MKRPRLRKWAKWTCTVAAVASVGMAVFSGFYTYELDVVSANRDTQWGIAVGEGIILIHRFDGYLGLGMPPNEGWHLRFSEYWYWSLGASFAGTPFPGHEFMGIGYNSSNSFWRVWMSVVYPVLLTTIPAAFLWYKDHRRFGPHACERCGYSRRGLAADAKCPECGTVPAIPSK